MKIKEIHDFKLKFIKKIEEFLKDRMEVYDKFRLSDTKETLNMEEVYQKYKQLVPGEDKRFRIPNYKNSFPIGKSVLFTKAEKEKLFAIIHEYLISTDIVHYPDSRGCFYDFIIDILHQKLFVDSTIKSTITEEQKDKIKKYIVALNCMKAYLSFTDDYSDFICNESEHFYIKDHTGKKFVNYNAINPIENEISDFTPLITNESLKVFSFRDNKTKKDAIFCGTNEKKEYHMFVNEELFKANKYDLVSSISMHEYLEYNNCLFLEQAMYSPNDIVDIISSIEKFRDMSNEEKEELHKIATLAAKFTLERYEYFSLYTNDIQAKDLALGYVSSEELYELAQKENKFIKTLRDEIKAQLLKKDFIRLILKNTSIGVLRRVIHKSDLRVPTVLEEIDIYTDIIVHRNLHNDREIIYSKNDDYKRALQSKKG